ncbi:hypothetical protein [Filimonas effusa]|nr:hypothetical protein [Filimonas effusa]
MQAEEEVAGMNGHTTTAMVRRIYDTKNKFRRIDLIKDVKNNFA